MYRYRPTTFSLDRATKHLHTIGKIISVRGYRFIGRGDTLHEAVIFRGESGTCRLTSLCWGYCGPETTALVELLGRIGVHREFAEHVVFNSTRHEDCGTDWSITWDGLDRRKYQTRERLAGRRRKKKTWF